MSNEDLYYMTASDMVRRFRDKSLSPVEVMEALMDRVSSVNEGVNALSHTFFDQIIDLMSSPIT